MDGHTHLEVRPDLDRHPWSDLAEPRPLHGHLARIGMLRHGTTSGRASVGLAIQLDDGRWVVAETTWRLFRGAARALSSSPTAAEEDTDS
ncbi:MULTISPECIES: hypothetical protein [Protofrankia]|uniref:Uncharacterized protein n=1 Tax=Protofrankia coriariae TaxID=1562887 RepID=A0ABR5F4F6_9ACTN|nr:MULTISPECIES: hypothetical protein [Protofrankia]KLL11569.1 hypothetical protein FrCorBMG51_11050 [Protofrankia coriariae]ONH35703.1 hypothetical protein BL254_10445 [Protofrankia sp. BMG5.30]